MGYYDFPHTRNYDTDLGYLIDWFKTNKNKIEENTAITIEKALTASEEAIKAYNSATNASNSATSASNSAELALVLKNQTEALKNLMQDKINQIDTNTNRINNLATIDQGSVTTTADAELVDIRVGDNGITYPSAGDSVRGQVSELKSDLVYYGNSIGSIKRVSLNNDIFTDKTIDNINISATSLYGGKESFLRSKIKIDQIRNLRISFTLRNLSNNATSVRVQANMNGQPAVNVLLGEAINNKEYNANLVLNQTGIEVYCYIVVIYRDNSEETYTISNLTYTIDNVIKQPYDTSIAFSQGTYSRETIMLDAIAKQKDIQNSSNNVLRNKKILFFGDSITDIDTDVKVYPKILEEDYGTINTCYAVAGSGFNCDSRNTEQIEKWGNDNDIIAQINKTISNVSSDNVDIIFVSAGTNDFGLSYSGDFGSVSDVTTEPTTPTIYGNIAKSMRLLKVAYPYAKMFYITPLPRFTPGLPYRSGNGRGFSLTDVRDAIKYCCEYYSIPCLDMYSLSGLYGGSEQSLYWSDSPNYLHPSDKYHKEIYAPLVANFIKQLY